MNRPGITALAPLFWLAWAWCPSGIAGENLVANGHFEAPETSDWSYQGWHDGSHGVFSEPSRPGTHVHILQILTPGPQAFSAISQRVPVLPGRNYRLTLDFFDSCPRDDGNSSDFLIATVDGETVFLHRLAGPGGSGWQRRQATFKAQGPSVEIAIKLQGETLGREESTVAIDDVELVEAPERLIQPFRPGYPFVKVTQRVGVPVGLAFSADSEQLAGYEPVERFRQITGQTPALLAWDLQWDPVAAPHERFDAIRAHVQPWARSGVVPILTVRGAAPLEVPEDVLEPFFRAWGREIADWGYPVLLRPWPGMEKQHAAGSARDFTELWRKALGWFAEEGASNVLWFWTPESLSKLSDPFYPGDAHVDFVGCPHGPASLEAIYEHFQLHYRRKALAIPGTTERDTLSTLDELTARLVNHFPRIEFYTHSIDRALLFSTSPPRFLDTPAWQGKSRLVQFRIPQQSPPRIMATLSERSDLLRAVLTNISEESAPAASDFTAEFYLGHPDQGGSPWGPPRLLRLGRGQEKIVQQAIRTEDARVPHLLVRYPSGAQLGPRSSPPAEEVQVFSLVPQAQAP